MLHTTTWMYRGQGLVAVSTPTTTSSPAPTAAWDGPPPQVGRDRGPLLTRPASGNPDGRA